MRGSESFGQVGVDAFSITRINSLNHIYTVLGDPMGRHMWDIPIITFLSEPVLKVRPMYLSRASQRAATLVLHMTLPLLSYVLILIQRIAITLILQLLAAMFVRLSLLALYLRIFKPIRWARVAIWSATAGTTVFYMGCIIVILVRIVPRPHQTWVAMAMEFNSRVVEQNVNIAQGYYGMLSDLMILAIPVKLVYGLTMDHKRKIGVLAVFLTGLM